MQRSALGSVILMAILALGMSLLLWKGDKAHAPADIALEGLQAIEVDQSPRGDQWFGSTTTPEGLTFHYPDPFGGRYVQAVEWPPRVERVAHEYACMEGPITAADGPLKTQTRKIINGREYCVTISREGAAGSAYTGYEYLTDKGGDLVVRITFTIRMPQCLNYEGREQDTCALEQDAFDADDMAGRIAENTRLPEG